MIPLMRILFHPPQTQTVGRMSFHLSCQRRARNTNINQNGGYNEDDVDKLTSRKEKETLPSLQKSKSPGSVEEEIVVLQTHNIWSRKYDKKYFCLFCDQRQAKLPRHLASRHKNEIEVAKYLAEKDSRVKRDMLTRLRNIGSHKHNLEVIRERKGEFMVVYRPSETTHWSEYSPCPFCYGYYAANVLWKHVKRCHFPQSCGSMGRSWKTAEFFYLMVKTV